MTDYSSDASIDPIRLTRQLCEIESTTYHEGAVGEFLADFLAGRGWAVEKTAVAQPAETILLNDNGYVSNPNDPPSSWVEEQLGYGAYYTRWPDNEPYYTSDPWRAVPRHNGMCNCAFLDGHAKTMTMDALIGPPEGSANCLWDVY